MGWTVCVPITDSQDYDLVVEMPGDGLMKVQVKNICREVRPGCFEAQLGIRGGTRGGIWKKPEEMRFDLLFIAAGDGTEWLIPRQMLRSSITVGIGTKNKRYQFGLVAERQMHLTVNQAS